MDIPRQLRATAAASFVLARNERSLLPLDGSGLGRVALIGPNAEIARTLGGGSATVYPPYSVSPLDGLRAAGLDVTFAPGTLGHLRTAAARAPWLLRPDRSGPGADVRFFSPSGEEIGSERRDAAVFRWMNGFAAIGAPEQVDRLEVSCLIQATEAGTYQLGVTGIGRFRLLTDEAVLFDETLTVRKGADVGETLMAPPVRLAPLALAAGQSVTVRLEHDVHTSPMAAFGTFFQLLLEPPHGTDDEEIEAAVALAAGSDVAVVVVGTTAEVESEGFDRTSLALPGRQDELVRKVAAANPRTVVVVNSGAPVLLPWADQVAAVLLTWFGGQEFGNALADVLLGEAEPGGRLPTTWPASEDGLPSAQPDNGVLTYTEGLFIGYRAFDRDGREPLFPFGYGRGYTTWSYDSITVDCDEANALLAPGQTTPPYPPEPPGRRRMRGGAEHRLPAGPRGRPGLRVASGLGGRAPGQVAGRLRRGGRGPRRDGDRRDPAARTRLPALGRRRLDAGGGHLRPRGGLVLGVPPAHRRRHAQVGMRLTARRLNRATLARQLLLRREPLEVAEAVRRVVALQAQEAASPYLALWNRLAPFDPARLDAAFAGHEVIKATLMRITLHAVTAADYPPFHRAMAESLRASRLSDRRIPANRAVRRRRRCPDPAPGGVHGGTPHQRGVRGAAERAARGGPAEGVVGAAHVRAGGTRRDRRTVVLRLPAVLPRRAAPRTRRRTAGRPACSGWHGATWKGSVRPRRPTSLSSPCSPGPRPGTPWTPCPGSSSGWKGPTAACCSTCPARRFPARTRPARRG